MDACLFSDVKCSAHLSGTHLEKPRLLQKRKESRKGRAKEHVVAKQPQGATVALVCKRVHIGRAPCGGDSCQITDKKTQTITETFPIREAAAGWVLMDPIFYLLYDSPHNQILCGCKAESNFN